MNLLRPPTIIGLGCATPSSSATQAQAVRFAIRTAAHSPDAARFAEIVYRRSGVANRASALLHSTSSGEALDQSFFEQRSDLADVGPGTAARMSAYTRLSPALAARAATLALVEAGPCLGERGARAITHIVTVSCTGFAAPGLDVALVAELGLSSNVQRLNIGFMGCHGGVVGLRTAHALAASSTEPANVLLVCLELCSLHMQYSDRHDQIIANALFADGAAALVVSNSNEHDRPCSNSLPSQPSRLMSQLRVRSAASKLFPNSTQAMGWSIGDHGFQMTLDESVPDLIRAQLGPWLREWLASCGLALDDARACARWAVHPGGPRILDAVGEALALPPHALACSRGVLSDHGNMSSPTVFFILDRLMSAARPQTESAPRADSPVILLGFGPGLTAEVVLLEPAT